MSTPPTTGSLRGAAFHPSFGLEIAWSDLTLTLPLPSPQAPPLSPPQIPPWVDLVWGERGLEVGFEADSGIRRVRPVVPDGGRQLRLRFESPDLERRLASALRRWSASCPARLTALWREPGVPFSDLYALALRAPADVHDLCDQLPVVVPWLAYRLRDVASPPWSPGRLPPRRALLGLLDLPTGRWLVRALKKLPPLGGLTNSLSLVRNLIMNPDRAKVWRHCAPLTRASALLLLQPPPGFSPEVGLLDEVSRLAPGVGDALVAALGTLSAHDRLARHGPGRIRDLETLLDVLGPHLSAAAERGLGIAQFPDPIWPGVRGQIEPILSDRGLRREGEQVGNCVGSLRSSAARGERAFYRVTEPERGTLGLRWHEDSLCEVELRGRANAPMSLESREAVRLALGLASPRCAEPSLLAPLARLTPLESLTVEVGRGTGGLADFVLGDADVVTLCERHTGQVILYDDDAALSPGLRAWATLRTERFRSGSDWLMDEDDEELPDLRGVVSTRMGGPVSVRLAHPRLGLVTEPGWLEDAGWLAAVNLKTPSMIGAVEATACPGLTGRFVQSLGVTQLAELRLDYCPDLDARALIDGPLSGVGRLCLQGCRLSDAGLAALIHRWRPRGVDLSFVHHIGPLTLMALGEAGARVTLAGLELSMRSARALFELPWARDGGGLILSACSLTRFSLAQVLREAPALKLLDCVLPSGDWSPLRGATLERLWLWPREPISEELLDHLSRVEGLEDLFLWGRDGCPPNMRVRNFERHRQLAMPDLRLPRAVTSVLPR